MQLFELLVGLMIGAPYPVVLALGGAGLALVPGIEAPVEFAPDLVRALFVAPILLDGGFGTPLRDLRVEAIAARRRALARLRRTRTIGDDTDHAIEEEPDWAEGHALTARGPLPDWARSTKLPPTTGRGEGPAMGLLIRDAAEPDLPAILAIHNHEILHGTAIWWRDPVDLADRQAHLRALRAKSYPFLVAERDRQFAGYASFGEFRPQAGFDRTVETSVYVHPDHRRRGIAAALLPRLIEAARTLGKHALVGGVEATNAASLDLHRRFGFTEAARLPQVGFKFGRYLDLVFMQLLLD